MKRTTHAEVMATPFVIETELDSEEVAAAVEQHFRQIGKDLGADLTSIIKAGLHRTVTMYFVDPEKANECVRAFERSGIPRRPIQ
jgi:hypothetical protein